MVVMETIEEFTKRTLVSDTSGHGFFHASRVVSLAKKISQKEGGSLRIIVPSALLHDCLDSKLFADEEAQKKKIIICLQENKYSPTEIEKIMDIITHLSWHLAKEKEKPFPYIEGNIVRDADRLEALGAVGIVRTIEYGSSKGRPFYNEMDLKREEGQEVKANPTTLSHFYDKLLLLEPHFVTETGKAMAKERTDFIRSFLAEFYREIN